MLSALRPNLLFTAAILATSGLALGSCSGPAFTNSGASGKGGADGDGGVPSASGGANSGDGGRAGASSGASGRPAAGGASGTASGGTRAGGASGAASGGTRAGGASGLAGLGGLGVGGGLGVAGALGAGFPSTDLLDDFQRSNGDSGASWRGATDGFTLRDGQLVDVSSGGQPLLWNQRFGANQEVFATLASFSEEASEINLVLKAQQLGEACRLIKVLYEPNRSRVGVEFCLNDNDWTELPAFSVTLKPGDQLGARATASGKVNVYRNGKLINTFDASAFPFADGHIGVNALSVPEGPAIWDDFGGGNTAP